MFEMNTPNTIDNNGKLVKSETRATSMDDLKLVTISDLNSAIDNMGGGGDLSNYVTADTFNDTINSRDAVLLTPLENIKRRYLGGSVRYGATTCTVIHKFKGDIGSTLFVVSDDSNPTSNTTYDANYDETILYILFAAPVGIITTTSYIVVIEPPINIQPDELHSLLLFHQEVDLLPAKTEVRLDMLSAWSDGVELILQDLNARIDGHISGDNTRWQVEADANAKLMARLEGLLTEPVVVVGEGGLINVLDLSSNWTATVKGSIVCSYAGLPLAAVSVLVDSAPVWTCILGLTENPSQKIPVEAGQTVSLSSLLSIGVAISVIFYPDEV